jgi:hypothetical protein
LEAQQFSTTTKLEGEIIFAINAAGGADKADGSGDQVDKNPTFSNRVCLDLETSFTGEDQLEARLQARNTRSFADPTGTDMARLGFEGIMIMTFLVSKQRSTLRLLAAASVTSAVT